MKSLPAFCLIGIGNELRSDDGLGPFIVRAIEGLELPRTDCLILQQLQTEILTEILKYDLVILVDASTEGEEIGLYPLDGHAAPQSSSHHFNAAILSALARELYGVSIPFWLCPVLGESFEIGDQLSAAAAARAAQAIQAIVDFISKADQESR